jgi:hypothetical protein
MAGKFEDDHIERKRGEKERIRGKDREKKK